jgi:hypothetical protein
MSISAIAGSSVYQAIYANQTNAAQGSSTTEAGYERTISNSSLTAISLDQPPSAASSNSESDVLAFGLAKAIDDATTVDPVTGHRELVKGAGDKLTAAVTKLLTDNGFSADDAAAATANLSKELAQGGKITLSLNQESDVTSTQAVAGTDATGTAAAAEVVSSQFASTINIGIDLDTGALSVSVQSQSAFLAGATAQSQTGSASDASASNGSALASQYGLSVSNNSSLVASQQPSSQHESPIQQLIDQLSSAKVSKQDQASSLLQQLSEIADGARRGFKVSDPRHLSPGLTIKPAGSSQVASATIGVRVPLAVKQTDKHGYGPTLYQRPDGSLGTYSLKPTSVSA